MARVWTWTSVNTVVVALLGAAAVGGFLLFSSATGAVSNLWYVRWVSLLMLVGLFTLAGWSMAMVQHALAARVFGLSLPGWVTLGVVTGALSGGVMWANVARNQQVAWAWGLIVLGLVLAQAWMLSRTGPVGWAWLLPPLVVSVAYWLMEQRPISSDEAPAYFLFVWPFVLLGLVVLYHALGGLVLRFVARAAGTLPPP